MIGARTKKMMVNDTYEYEFIKSLLKPSSVCLDIGANVGFFTQLMAEYGNHVFAFEPDIDNFKILRDNIRYQQRSNYTLINKAVTDNTGLTRLYRCYSNIGMHRIYPSKYCLGDSVEIECTSIDEWWLPWSFSIDFVKIDVEGSELGVLQGMEKTITKFKPAMVVEFHPPSIEECGGPDNPRKIYNFLKKHYGSISLLATSFSPGTTDIPNISYDDLIKETYDAPARNIFVKG